MFIQSIECSGIEFDQLGFWSDLRVRGLTNLKLMKFSTKPSNNLLWPWRRYLKCQFNQLWLGLLNFIFGSKTFPSFSPKPLNHFASSLSHCVLLTVLFPTVYNIWIFIAREHHHHFRIFGQWRNSGVL
jgi:hypothetical protein